MGGLGSGRWSRFDPKETVEDYKALDICALNKKGLLEPGNEFEWAWFEGRTRTASVIIRVQHCRILLSYYYKFGVSDDWRKCEEMIPISRSGCNYGGNRPWFCCPICDKRVATLYLVGPHFRCRHCANLTYASRNLSEVERLARKTRKIRKRLGASPDFTKPIWFCPAGMQEKTFRKLKEKALSLEMAILSTVHTSQGSLRSRLDLLMAG